MVPLEALQQSRVAISLVGGVRGLDAHAARRLLEDGREDEARVQAGLLGDGADGALEGLVLGVGVGAHAEVVARAGVEFGVALVAVLFFC